MAHYRGVLLILLAVLTTVAFSSDLTRDQPNLTSSVNEGNEEDEDEQVEKLAAILEAQITAKASPDNTYTYHLPTLARQVISDLCCQPWLDGQRLPPTWHLVIALLWAILAVLLFAFAVLIIAGPEQLYKENALG